MSVGGTLIGAMRGQLLVGLDGIQGGRGSFDGCEALLTGQDNHGLDIKKLHGNILKFGTITMLKPKQTFMMRSLSMGKPFFLRFVRW